MSDAPPILFVTGMSGAGKSTALQVLEDMGWDTIDNVPVRFLDDLVRADADDQAPLAIGIDSRTRGFVPVKLEKQLRGFESDGRSVTLLFLDCAAQEIERRYNETRRLHPMARGRPVLEGIAAERELLEPLRRSAELLIDTSRLASNELQQSIRARFADAATRSMTVTITSFGFARGMPPLADLVFDMRFLDNPHWIPELREQTGRDPAVANHIEGDPGFAPAFAAIRACVLELLPRYEAQDRAYLTIAFGCTGGRHRSVYTAERMAEVLRETGRQPTVLHRNLGAAPSDATELEDAGRP